jgi:hypothetical protein
MREHKPKIKFYLNGQDLLILSSHPRFIAKWRYTEEELKNSPPEEYGKIDHEYFWGIYFVNNDPIKEGNISRWVAYPNRKPSGDRYCYVNFKSNYCKPVIAYYRTSEDVFIKKDENQPLAISHFIELPLISEADK